ncbi:MAG: diguanylate cyclase [Rhodospirillaceae bacterium]|jgi:HD-GYP domain-containing protein (c-di-GMP phosphodiesterase class II)|nr:diguanylate cyclase [Rhodospirillaceae bacterium]|tara:strand:- start:9237 stop:11033 length:1797 start_codon:yes stop_codon:yes gene_type:complete
MAKKAKKTPDQNKASSFERLIEIGIALSAEQDTNRLMETILLEAKELSNADGGTLYLKTEDNNLKFEIVRTDSLKIAMGGTTGKEIIFPPVLLYDPETGKENKANVASCAGLTGKSINIPDAYDSKDFDFSGTRKFDEVTGYRSKSFLTVPMKNSQDEIIGVLQLLNAQDEDTGEVIPFSSDIQPLIEALASQAAVALDNKQLLDAQKLLLDSFIKLIASAIDAKSPYTGGHCQRVPELTMMLAKAACDAKDGPLADFDLSEDDWYELTISALLHDCGKVTTPEYVVDKATKLETIYDRIHEIRTRFEVVKREAEIEYLKAVADGKGDTEKLRAELGERLAKLDDDFAFIAKSNIGGEFMAPEKIERVEEIAHTKWTRTLDDRLGISQEEKKRKDRTPPPDLPVVENLLSDRDDHIIYREEETVAAQDEKHRFKLDVPELKFNLGEAYNLSIPQGTLTAEERFKINDHIMQTIVMLEQLPFPEHLKRVPEYAGGHHEKMDGTGYPRKLNKDDMSIPARIMAIADIFEALTAVDRPYKAPKTLSESVKIMSFMKKDAHIDGDLFELFLTSGVYKEYADQFLEKDQIDEVDISEYLEGDE